MDANITEQQYSDDNLQLPEPHFDEEATVLSARPVVPLDEIREVSPRRHLAFGLSIVASMILGGLVATFVFKQRGQLPATEITESAIAGTGANAGDSVVPESSNDKVQQNVTPEPLGNETLEPPTVQAPAPAASKRREPQTIQSPAEPAEDDPIQAISREEIRERRRAERLEERRLKRQLAREALYPDVRRRRGRDDLLRIREIFEGSRRP